MKVDIQKDWMKWTKKTCHCTSDSDSDDKCIKAYTFALKALMSLNPLRGCLW